jgi:hypothetical protein
VQVVELNAHLRAGLDRYEVVAPIIKVHKVHSTFDVTRLQAKMHSVPSVDRG